LNYLARSSTSAPEELSDYADTIYESNYVAAMIERRPTRRRSNPRDNRWRGTLPEANILIQELLGLSTSKFLDTEFEDNGHYPRISGRSHSSFIVCRRPAIYLSDDH
jgi:hypothetical protein